MKVREPGEPIPTTDILREASFDFVLGGAFLVGTIAAARAVKHAIASGSFLQAGIWAGATLGAAFMGEQFAKGGVETIQDDIAHNQRVQPKD